MMDVSDGLLVDASRIADASALALKIELGDVPLSAAFMEMLGEDRGARMFATTAGDDYELLFAADKGRAPELLALAEGIGIPLSRVGRFGPGSGIRLFDGGQEVQLDRKSTRLNSSH